MKVLIEIDIAPRAHEKAELDPEQVTRRLMRRINNADVSELWLEYEDPKLNRNVEFIATIKGYTAVEEHG
jgi:hypothetical protein